MLLKMKQHKKKINKALKSTVDLWANFLDIPDSAKHSDDTVEMRRDIHNIQNRLYTMLYKLKVNNKQ